MEQCPDYLYELNREQKMEEEVRKADEIFAEMIKQCWKEKLLALRIACEIKTIYQDKFDLDIDYPTQSLLKNHQLTTAFIVHHLENRMPTLYRRFNK